MLLSLTIFAARAADGGPVRVSARVERRKGDGESGRERAHTLVLRVVARDVALSSEQLATAFEPYVQDTGGDAGQRVRACVPRNSLLRDAHVDCAPAGGPVAVPARRARLAAPGRR